MTKLARRLALACALTFLACGVHATAAEELEGLTIVVMDPLSSELACDCVEGYAQRNYDKLGEYLQKFVDRPISVVYVQALGKALEEGGRADLIIGKHSVIVSDAAKAEVEITPVAQLSGKDGSTTQTGLIVVLKDDPAKTVADLKGYRVLFGPADCDEKSAAPMKLLQANGVAIPDDPETCPACSDAAAKLLELGPTVRAAGVISSYAQPLLEGCGTVKKGDLRVIGESEKVPFVTAFFNKELPDATRERLLSGLMEVQYDIQMLIALESKVGFVLYEDKAAAPGVAKKKD